MAGLSDQRFVFRGNEWHQPGPVGVGVSVFWDQELPDNWNRPCPMHAPYYFTQWVMILGLVTVRDADSAAHPSLAPASPLVQLSLALLCPRRMLVWAQVFFGLDSF